MIKWLRNLILGEYFSVEGDTLYLSKNIKTVIIEADQISIMTDKTRKQNGTTLIISSNSGFSGIIGGSTSDTSRTSGQGKSSTGGAEGTSLKDVSGLKNGGSIKQLLLDNANNSLATDLNNQKPQKKKRYYHNKNKKKPTNDSTPQK